MVSVVLVHVTRYSTGFVLQRPRQSGGDARNPAFLICIYLELAGYSPVSIEPAQSHEKMELWVRYSV